LVLILVPALLGGQKHKVEKQEIDLLIKSVKFLEERPLDKKAKDVRSWGVKWIIATDKVSVNVCSLILSGPEKYKYNSELLAQYTIGMAAFKLSNPDKARDDGAAQLAGFQSALIVYEAIVAQDPNANLQLMDDLLTKRADGSLPKYLTENNCKKK
jgi:hypothetical protein